MLTKNALSREKLLMKLTVLGGQFTRDMSLKTIENKAKESLVKENMDVIAYNVYDVFDIYNAANLHRDSKGNFVESWILEEKTPKGSLEVIRTILLNLVIVALFRRFADNTIERTLLNEMLRKQE